MQSTPISNLKNSNPPPIPNMSSSYSEPSLQTCQNEVTCYNLQTASDHDISYRWAPVRFVSLQQDGFDMEVNVVDPTSLETGNNVVRDEDSFDFNEDLKTALAGNTTLLHDDYVPPDTIMPPLKPRILGIQIETNEEGILLEKNNKHQKKNMDGNEQEKDDQLRFPLKDVDLLIERSNPKDENIERLILELKPVMRHPDDEWYAVVQTRFYVARTGEKFRMAGAEVFSLGKRCEPLELRLEPEVDALKVEMRYVYQTFHRMPTFTEGDMQLFFPKEEKDAEVPVCVDRALLSLFCPKFERAIGNQPFNECFNPHVDVNRQQFVELLYQVYRTKRPLNANLEQLCVAVNKVAGPQLQWKLRQHFVNDTEKSSMEKAKRAAQLGLDDTVIHLCYDAVKTREWKPLQKEDDFDAPSFFGPEVYGRLVLPAAIQAIKDLNSADPNIRALLFEQKFPIAKPDFVSPFESGNPNSVQLQADQHIFNVNIGVLRVHACLDKFAVGCDNTYRPIVSSALKAELQRCQIQLAQAVLPVLEMLYGVTNRVPNHLVRACLIFAHDHGMRSVVEDLEELLIDEPNDHSGMMLNHLMMAEQYELANLKRHSLWQLELIQCQPIALAMIQLPEYGKLSRPMRLDVEDRICSGWAKFESKMASREPTNLKAYLFGLLGKDKAKVEPATMDNNAMELATVELVGDPPFDHFSNYQALLAEQDDLRTAQHPEDIVNQQQK